jgi:hypothetical protein
MRETERRAQKKRPPRTPEEAAKHRLAVATKRIAKAGVGQDRNAAEGKGKPWVLPPV